MAKYDIKFKDGRKPLKNISQEEALAFKEKNLDKIGTFQIILIDREMPKVSKNEKEDARVQFMKDLSMIQQQEIKKGQKEIKYSKTLGWYLQVVQRKKGEESFYTPTREMNKRRVDMKKMIDSALALLSDTVYEKVKEMNPDYEFLREEFDITFNK